MPRVASETNSPHHAAHGQRRSNSMSQPRSDTSPFASLLDTADSQAATADSPATGRAARLDPSRKSDAPTDPRRSDAADDGRDVPANSQANQTGNADPSAAVAKTDATSAQKDDAAAETAVQTTDGDDTADNNDQQVLGFTDGPPLPATPGIRSTPVVPINPFGDGGSRPIVAREGNPAGATPVPETTFEPCGSGNGQDRPQTQSTGAAATTPGKAPVGSGTKATAEAEDTAQAAAAEQPADPKTNAALPQEPRNDPQATAKFELVLKAQATTDSTITLKSDSSRDDKADPLPAASATSADPVRGLSFTATTSHLSASANAGSASAATTASNAVPIAGIAVEIATQARSGNNRFDIRLDPPELGRIDVRLDVDKHGRVTSHLVVDRVETLDLLRRDSAGLERALQDAGLKTSDNGLNFSLRDQSFNQGAGEQGNWNTARIAVPDDTASPLAFVQDSTQIARLGGVDIRV